VAVSHPQLRVWDGGIALQGYAAFA
jgi:hypothetical protein